MLLPFVRILASGSVELTRWEKVTLSNATALYFLSIIGPVVAVGYLLDKLTPRMYVKLPVIVIVGIGAYFLAGVVSGFTTPF